MKKLLFLIGLMMGLSGCATYRDLVLTPDDSASSWMPYEYHHWQIWYHHDHGRKH